MLLEDIKEKRGKLRPLKIGKCGQLWEWYEEYKEWEPGHRHLSHLCGLFPGELLAGNEELMKACRVSLLHRLENGGGHTGWSCAWIINLFAVLKDDAYGLGLLKVANKLKNEQNIIFFLFLPALLRYDQQMTFCKFKVCDLMI